MQMIIEARLVDDRGETAPVRLSLIDRELTTVSNGMDAPTRSGINVPKWKRHG